MSMSAFTEQLKELNPSLQITREANQRHMDYIAYTSPEAEKLGSASAPWRTAFEGIDRMRGKAAGGVEETKTWRNSFLFSGEEPVTKSNSRAGSKNRVIDSYRYISTD